MVLAHLPSGYVLAQVNETLWGKPKKKSLQYLIALLTTLGAIFPDLDTLPFFLGLEPLAAHRKYITHTFFPYLIIYAALFVWLQWKKPKKIYLYQQALFAFFSGVILHLLTDSLISGVRWLYPLNDIYYALIRDAKITVFTGNNLVDYMFTPFFLLEILFFIWAFWLYFYKNYLRIT